MVGTGAPTQKITGLEVVMGDETVTGPVLRGSFGTVDLTPSSPVPLFGYAFRRDPFVRVASPIEANVAVLRRDGRTILLIGGDFLYLTGALRDDIVAAHGARHGFGRADVLLAASHTHFAPAIDPTKPGLGAADPAYIDEVHDMVRRHVGQLLDAPDAPVTLRHARRPSRHNCNRRSAAIRPDGTVGIDDIMTDPGNVFDDMLDVVTLGGEDGAVRAALVRYACHATSYPDKPAVTPEFPGIIRNALRRAAGRDGLPVLFLQGFAGDMVPLYPARPDPRLASAAERLAPVKREGVLPIEQWEQWTASLAEEARQTFAAAQDSAPVAPRLGAHERHIALTEMIDGLADAHRDLSMSMQAIELSDDLLMVALSAEPTAAWAEIVADLAPGRTVLPVGYVNQTYGYLPAGRELSPQDYMSGGFFAPFGLSGRFRPDIEQRVVAELERLLAPVARADIAAYRQRVAALRAQIDDLRTEREVARAFYLDAEAKLAGRA
jgi:hypothetical protein